MVFAQRLSGKQGASKGRVTPPCTKRWRA